MSKIETPRTIYLKDYQPPEFTIESVSLDFDLSEPVCRVVNRMAIVRSGEGDAPLRLDGSPDLKPVSVSLDGGVLEPSVYDLTPDTLTIKDVPGRFTLEIVTDLKPQENTRLMGLYQSGGNFCTQCEAEGFRRITYYLDRPDVMARYSVRIEADRVKYPVLLSNGNLVEKGELAGGRHWVRWDDPFPKPSYLFALVAGDLALLEDYFITGSGRRVRLCLYAAEGDIGKCDYAMAALKKSMKWDEDTFGLEYDLDIYNIVAVSDFNMGAMENKSLNIFNTKYVLARPETATDQDFEGIETVIGHEYFHNWTGNRVTCRDWFQLSLKEGLTVFRDQEFSSDMGSRAVKRIEDVRILRAHQFSEDAGPMAHPVRPHAYMEINNFYTVTVYNKGAEVIRMMHTLLGPDHFRKGMDLYFERHDGQAVTCDDFAAAMQDASNIDLGQFKLWYEQAGTPLLHVKDAYDADQREYRLTVTQNVPDTAGQTSKKPMHIPLQVGLLNDNGAEMRVELDGDGTANGSGYLLNIRDNKQHFLFRNVPSRPVPSLLRGFSAPVMMASSLTRADLMFLLANDNDPFARWEAGQQLATGIILDLIRDIQNNRKPILSGDFIEAIAAVLDDRTLDPALAAEAVDLPSEIYLGQLMDVIDPDAIHQAREFVRDELLRSLADRWQAAYENNQGGAYSLDRGEKARRKLKNTALGYLMQNDSRAAIDLAFRQFEMADNMTDRIAALIALSGADAPARQQALAAFYEQWKNEALVIDKWFTLQALSKRETTLADVQKLAAHPAFTLKNPNRARALIGAFTAGNQVRFHDKSGVGYRFLADMILKLDSRNPQMASRLIVPFSRLRKYDSARQGLIQAELERIVKQDGLSKDVYEIAAKSLE